MRRIYLELSSAEQLVDLEPFWSKWLSVFAVSKLKIPASIKVADTWYDCVAELNKSKGRWQAFLDWGEEIKQATFYSCSLGLLKTFYMELALRGLSESIVDEVFIVAADHSIAKLNRSLCRRWATIALEHSAIKGRLLPLSLKYVDHWERLFERSDLKNIILLDKSGAPITRANINKNCCFFVGPEGGFSKRELDYFYSQNISVISLGEETLSSWFSAVSFASFLTLRANLIEFK